MRSLILLTALSSLVNTGLVQADEVNMNNEHILDLDKVTVSANRIVKPVKSIPHMVTIIDKAQINDSKIINDTLSGVLEQNVPDFSPASTNLTDRSVSLRGRNPLYLIDGVPQHNALRDGQRDGYTIDLDFIDSIEVIHGANAVQGIGAIGGVINLVTKRATPGKTFSGSIKTKLETDDAVSSDGLHKKVTGLLHFNPTEKLSTTLGLSRNMRGLFYDGNGDVVGLYGTQGDIADSVSDDIFFKARYEHNQHKIQFMVNDFNLERNGDYKTVAGNRDAGLLTSLEKGDPSATVGDPAEQDVNTISLDYVNEDFHTWRIVSQLYRQKFKAKYEGGTFGTFFSLTTADVANGIGFLDQSQIESEKIGLKLLASKKVTDKFTFSVGIDRTEDESAQTLAQSGREWVPLMKLTETAPFVQVDYDITDSLYLTAGVRYEDAELEVDDYVTLATYGSRSVQGGNPKYNDTLKNIGLIFDFAENNSVYASYSEGFTLPDVGRVLRGINTDNQTVNNLVDLDPIVTKNYEIGYRYNNGRFNLDTSIYLAKSDFGSLLVKDANDIFSVTRQEIETKGITVTTRYKYNNQTNFGLNYSLIKGRQDSDKDGKLDSDIDGANIGPNKLMAFVQHKFNQDWNMRLSAVKYFERSFRGPANESRNGKTDFDRGYELVHLAVNGKVAGGDLTLGIQNLFDKQYVTYFSQTESNSNNGRFFAGRGRALGASYQYNF
jgi:iron complex outermembrane receptor protein